MTAPRPFDEMLSAYVDITLRVGINLQRDQTLVINIAPGAAIEEAAPFVRRLTRRAYEMGARHVYVEWGDADLARTQMELMPAEALTEVPLTRMRWLEELAEGGAAFVSLVAPNATLFDGIDPTRVASAAKAGAQAGAKLAASASTLRHQWTVVAFASRAWARQAFPHLDEIAALAALWDYIFAATRVGAPDPVEAWKTHLAGLNTHASYLSAARFRRLHYRAPGTELRLGLPEKQVWISGGNSVSVGGIPFVPNVPTEEVFCAPERNGVEGEVTSTMPLNYNGTLIEGLRLRFEGGRIVEYEASAGMAALERLIETDDGSHYLGEVALVPANSPINRGTPVYSTLFDENASCHLAIGRAYPICIEGGATMSPDELLGHGANMSLAHVDFMIGSEQLDIDGETASGELVPVFRRGMWAHPEA